MNYFVAFALLTAFTGFDVQGSERIKLPFEAAMVMASEGYSGAMVKAREQVKSLGCDELGYTTIFIEEAPDFSEANLTFELRCHIRRGDEPAEVVRVGKVTSKIVFRGPALAPKIDSVHFLNP